MLDKETVTNDLSHFDAWNTFDSFLKADSTRTLRTEGTSTRGNQTGFSNSLQLESHGGLFSKPYINCSANLRLE